MGARFAMMRPGRSTEGNAYRAELHLGLLARGRQVPATEASDALTQGASQATDQLL